MPKLQFLCAHHHNWLHENPKSAASVWIQAYGAAVECIEEYNYALALRHAGAAFEAAEILLSRESSVTHNNISRFSESGVLLIQLLHRLDEARQAGPVLAAAIGRLEQLLSNPEYRQAVMEGCQSLMRIGDDLPARTTNTPAPRPITSTIRSAQVH